MKTLVLVVSAVAVALAAIVAVAALHRDSDECPAPGKYEAPAWLKRPERVPGRFRREALQGLDWRHLDVANQGSTDSGASGE